MGSLPAGRIYASPSNRVNPLDCGLPPLQDASISPSTAAPRRSTSEPSIPRPALIPPDQRYDFNGNIRHVLPNVGDIVFTRFRIEEMRSGKMCLSPLQCEQATLRANVCRGKPAVVLGKEL